MGCLLSLFYQQSDPGTDVSRASPAPSMKETVQRPTLSPSDYTFSHLLSQTQTRLPGSIPLDCPLIIEDCTDSTLVLLCVSSQVTVDACSRCFLVIGPSTGSVFLRDVVDSTLIIIGQQLR